MKRTSGFGRGKQPGLKGARTPGRKTNLTAQNAENAEIKTVLGFGVILGLI
jgi:hypothetical protein